jgi:hypothetical protein
MVDKIIDGIFHTLGAIPFSGATWFVLAILAFFVFLFVKADHDPTSPVSWEDLIVDSVTRRASPYKLGYLIGLIVGTWVVVYLTDKGTLSIDMFGGYLAYLLGGAGWGLKKSIPPDTSDDPPPVVPPAPVVTSSVTPAPVTPVATPSSVNVTVVDTQGKTFAPPPAEKP